MYKNIIVLIVLVCCANALEDGMALRLRSSSTGTTGSAGTPSQIGEEKPIIVNNVSEAMGSSKPVVNTLNSSNKKCCKEDTKKCMACKNGMTIEEFCERLPGKFGCEGTKTSNDGKVVVAEAVASALSIKAKERVKTAQSEGRLYVANVNDTVIDPVEDTNCCHSEHIRLACCPVVGEGSPALQGLISAYKASKARSDSLRKRLDSASDETKKLEKMVIDQRQSDEDAITKKAEEKEKYSQGLDIKIPSTLRSNNPKGAFSVDELAA
jgi:hypothetical protein